VFEIAGAARLIGIETEYGFASEGVGPHDLLRESAAIVASYAGRSVSCWNYGAEDPRRDLRGFRVSHLATNPDDAQYDTASVGAGHAERADRILENGARLYNDHGHPEYSTPECGSLLDLVAHDRAGEEIVQEAARLRSEATSRPVRVYKNNTDYHGASYGTHESYLTLRSTEPERLIADLLPFLVTRQIYAGAGKVGVEGDRGAPPLFQLSQRSDFCAVEASVDTLHNRPIVNTRDEPHAPPALYRRLHVIIGDANLSEWATAIKVGTTCAVLHLIESGWRPSMRVLHPVEAIKRISRDPTLQWLVHLDDGRVVRATDVQRHYLEAARRLGDADEEALWLLDEWETALDALDRDPSLLRDRVDWVAKRMLLEEFLAEESTSWGDPLAQSLDLAYHELDGEQGLQRGLVACGAMRRLVSERAVAAARTCPPANTRAFLRGLFVRRFPAAVKAVGWSGLAFVHGAEEYWLDMSSLVDGFALRAIEAIGGCTTLDDVVGAMRSLASAPSAEQGVPR